MFLETKLAKDKLSTKEIYLRAGEPSLMENVYWVLNRHNELASALRLPQLILIIVL